MVCYFIGGAAGSVSAGTLYDSHGWAGVCLLGAGFGVATLALSAYERWRVPNQPKRPERVDTAAPAVRAAAPTSEG
jgi:MFS family permease